MFIVKSNCNINELFFIHMENKQYILYDYEVAAILTLELKQYRNILKKYNGYRPKHNSEFFFNTYEDCRQCCDYLNENYGIILKLMED